MLCPRCDQPDYHPDQACPHCQFSGDPALVEELAHVTWMLNQIARWTLHNEADQQFLRQLYVARRRKIETQLGLRLAPLSDGEAHKAWLDLFRREALLQQLAEWLTEGLIQPAAHQALVDQVKRQVKDLLQQLEGHLRPAYHQTDADRLDLTNFLLEAADHLSQTRGFVTPQAEEQARRRLLAQKEKLEIVLGLRAAQAPPPQKSRQPQPSKPPPDISAPPPPGPPAAPPLPLRDRLWRTLLSERTLQALLFLGIFLLFSAAISFVVWGWKDFSAPLRVTIPAGFTATFFALGWYVRDRTHLYRSGIALSAIAALLIPIDFYTVYANFDIPPDYAPSFWLVTSLACLAAYIVITQLIQNAFFGYLVGAAAGSTVLAAIQIGHQSFGLSLDWRPAGLSGLALGFTVLTALFGRISRKEPRAGGSPRAHIFADPLRYLSLIAMGALMPLTFGWRYIGRDTYDLLHYAMTATWGMGAFIFGWGAVYHRSYSLGLLAAISLPIATYMAQAAAFDQAGINPAWHALGWAVLVPIYFITGRALLARKDDPVLYSHGRTAAGWGVALLVAAAFWSLTDLASGTAAACSHAILSGAVVLAALLWQRPKYLYGASLLSFSAVTFAMAELNLTLPQSALGWASLAIVHVIIALNAGSYFAGPIATAGYVIAALALLPALFPYDGNLLAYTLGNWLGLAAWGARLAHQGRAGFAPSPPPPLPTGEGSHAETKVKRPGWKIHSPFHWLTAAPLPVWIWVLYANRGPLDVSLPLTLAALAWGIVALSYRLARIERAYRWPWYLAGMLVSLVAVVTAFAIAPDTLAPPICLLAVGLLYLVDAVINRQSWELTPGGWATAGGFGLLLYRLNASFDGISFALALLTAAYFLAGLWTERKRSPVFTHRFLAPLYMAAHIVSLVVLWRIYFRSLYDLLYGFPWTDEMLTWGAVDQCLLGVVYGLYAWDTFREHWGHAAAWLVAAGGGFIAIAYSQGRGSSAAKGALGVIAFVLAERGLHWLRQRPSVRDRRQAIIRLAWRLYRRPLLVTGWIASAGVIGLALVRNLWLLGGGRIPQTWAAIGLMLITGLYALSARLFRQARFTWLAAVLVFAPWTILTNLGWFVFPKPTTPGFAISWVMLAWVLYLCGLALDRFASRAYALPPKWAACTLLPLSLLWGVANTDTSRFTFALAIGFYGLAARVDHRRLKSVVGGFSILEKTKFLYPALGLIPVWCVYLMRWLVPAARHELYGLMLLTFCPLGLVAGQWLRRVAPQRKAASGYALPAYLTGYVTLIVGTLLVAHLPALLALALLYDALLMLVSARLFKHPLWVYPAAAMAPLSLLIALNEAGIAGNRHGWWLIGLAAIYLMLAWALRRVKLPAYGTATLAAGFALIALGLPPSSQDKTGALWGYGSAAVLYAMTAAWLRQPLLLTPACALAIVPYALILQRSALRPEYYGLALFPGALAALAAGWGLDARLGRWQGFPWGDPLRWAKACGDRLLNWWALPLYALGLGLAAASPLFTQSRSGLSALNFLLMMPLFGWAIRRFRLRVWLLALALAGHLAAFYYLDELGWWRYPAYAWARFLPVTLITTLIAVLIEWRRKEGSPLHLKRCLVGWSRPLYGLALLDIMAAQLLSLSKTGAGSLVTLTHALLMAALASLWLSSWMPYISTALGLAALFQWLLTLSGPAERLPVALAQLALAYGLAGYGLAFVRNQNPGFSQKPGFSWATIWEPPLQRSGIALSFGVLALANMLGSKLMVWTFMAMMGFPFRQIVNIETVQMVVSVLALLGLLYVGAAFTYRRLRLGYAAIGMLLAAWLVHAFYIQQWDGAVHVQWYAAPAGVYLLGIAYLEWRRGNKTLARWLDYAAVLLMMGSLFWQTLLFGWRYALMLGAEGFVAFWWGSARRLRRFLYVGMLGVVLATVAQLINSLQSINQWIVFGLIGLMVIVAAVLIERKLEEIKTWLGVLETWE